jgi:hypothetical protein
MDLLAERHEGYPSIFESGRALSSDVRERAAIRVPLKPEQHEFALDHVLRLDPCF